ncbi:MAG: patatin family protein [Tyzzerella sp.]|nr:patatin family protein [Tyzzerella sp.]
MKTGLVLEGGGMRGIYTAGVLDAFLENNIEFDGVIGVSAGAIHGCSFVSRQKGRSIRYYKKYCKDPRFMSFRSLILTGDFVGADFCYHELPEKLDIYDYDTFNKSNTKFYVPCTDLETGKALYKHMTDMHEEIDYLRASASLPYFSKPVILDGKKYLDGAVADSVPVKAFQEMGYERNVVVLTREDGYVKKPEHAGLSKIGYRKYPAFVKALQNRHMNYNETLKEIKQLEADGKVLVIRPAEPLNIGRLESDPEKIEAIYNIGYHDGLAVATKVKEFIN